MKKSFCKKNEKFRKRITLLGVILIILPIQMKSKMLASNISPLLAKAVSNDKDDPVLAHIGSISKDRLKTENKKLLKGNNKKMLILRYY